MTALTFGVFFPQGWNMELSSITDPQDKWARAVEVAEKIRTYVGLGCTGFIPWCSDYPDTESMRLLAERVIPELR